VRWDCDGCYVMDQFIKDWYLLACPDDAHGRIVFDCSQYAENLTEAIGICRGVILGLLSKYAYIDASLLNEHKECVYRRDEYR
jgi:hypothetical protein